MSNNSGVENNASRRSNYSVVYQDSFTIQFISYMALDSTFTVAGTLINVWFLTAMLLSPRIRSQLRNKIICALLVANLIETAIICPLFMFMEASNFLIKNNILPCHFLTAHANIFHIQNILGNWYIFILVCVYAAQVMNFEPKFTPLWKKMLTAVIITSPCVFAVFFVPLTMTSYGTHYNNGCIIARTSALFKVFKYVDAIVPQALAILLLAVTAVFKRRRHLQEPAGTLRAQLIDDRSQMDPLYPVVALLVTAVFCDVGEAVIFLNLIPIFEFALHTWMSLLFASTTLSYLRLLIIPGVLLLFPDIRERIKTWRPCRRSAPPADLVVTYKKNTSRLSQISL